MSLLHSASIELPSTQQNSQVSPAEMIQEVCRHRSRSYWHNEIGYIGYIIIELWNNIQDWLIRHIKGYLLSDAQNFAEVWYSLVCLQFFSAEIWRYLSTNLVWGLVPCRACLASARHQMHVFIYRMRFQVCKQWSERSELRGHLDCTWCLGEVI